MKESYLTSETYGIGELISQKKRFRVPRHQRDYSWSAEEVETYINDIISSLDQNREEYFIGLIVLYGPHNGVWDVLDGQQRIATTTMMFSAIRQWLTEYGFDSDAKQIDEEFIALRRLGKEPIARLMMNSNDRKAFEDMVLDKTSKSEIRQYIDVAPDFSSLKKLAEAALTCRIAVESWAQKGGSHKDAQVGQLYRLAAYMESNVQAVCMEVGSEANAYTIFESLNYRGLDLSVLDLVKNHIYGMATTADEDEITGNWDYMKNRIEERDADDFLKVFWTSQFGRVQRGNLFKEVKNRFYNANGVKQLIDQLAQAADPYVASEEPSHEIWADYPAVCSHFVSTLVRLRSKQVRSIILAALRKRIAPSEMVDILYWLTKLTVRYQTVGRRRTGALEIQCARVAYGITLGNINRLNEVKDSMGGIMPDDDSFRNDFIRYSEQNKKRAMYMMSALETYNRYGNYDVGSVEDIMDPMSETTVATIMPVHAEGSWIDSPKDDPDFYTETINKLANQVLIEKSLHSRLNRSRSYEEVCDILGRSSFELTAQVPLMASAWNRQTIQSRQERLADLAIFTWE